MNKGLRRQIELPSVPGRAVRRGPLVDKRLQGPVQPPTPTLPPGMVMPFAGAVAPIGWLLCDGSAVGRQQYSALFAMIGTTYGAGDGYRTFNLPNLLGRVIAGVDAGQTEFAALAQTGGEKVHTTTLAEMPIHGHTVTVDANNFNSAGPNDNLSDWPNNNTSDGGSGTTNWQSDTHADYQHWHGARIGNVGYNYALSHAHHDRGGFASEAPWEDERQPGGTIPVNVDTVDTNHYHNTGPHTHTMANHAHPLKNHWHNVNHAHTNSVTTSGGSAAHNNLQPYMTMQYLIKT